MVTLTFSWPHFHVFFSCGLAGLSFSPTTLDLLSHRRRFSLSDEKDPSSYFVDLFLSNRNGPIEFSYVAQGRWEMLGVRVETVWKKCAWGLKMGCALHHRIETPENGARVLFLLHHHRPRPNSYKLAAESTHSLTKTLYKNFWKIFSLKNSPASRVRDKIFRCGSILIGRFLGNSILRAFSRMMYRHQGTFLRGVWGTFFYPGPYTDLHYNPHCKIIIQIKINYLRENKNNNLPAYTKYFLNIINTVNVTVKLNICH